MTQASFTGIIRAILTAIGGFLIGKNFLGHTIDESIWQGVLGAVMSIAAIIWSWIEKELTLESLQGAIRNFVSLAGGIFAGWGVISNELLVTILGFVVPISQLVYSWLSRSKSKQLESGKMNIAQLKK